SGGATKSMFQRQKTYTSRCKSALLSAFASALVGPFQRSSISFVPRSLTSSIPAKSPRPRTSPTDGCRSATLRSSSRSLFPIRAEPAAGPAEAGHDLVEDQQDPVPVAEGAQPAKIAIGRHEHTGRPGDRLDEDRRDVFGAFVPDDLLDVRERFLNVRSEDGTVRIRVQEVHDAGDPWLGRPAAVVPAEGHRSLRLADER